MTAVATGPIPRSSARRADRGSTGGGSSAESVGFGRALRAAGPAIDLGAAIDFARALTLVDIGDREQVRAAGAALFVRRRDDREIYDARLRPVLAAARRKRPPRRWPTAAHGAGDEARAPRARRRGRRPARTRRRRRRATIDGIPMPIAGGTSRRRRARSTGSIVAPDAYSVGELLRHRDFDRMTAAELRDAERLVDLLVPRLELRRTRR